MIKQINFGLLIFTLRFLTIDAKSFANTKYKVESIRWADTSLALTISEHDSMPDLYDDFEAYLEAIMPAVANDETPTEPAPFDYNFKSHAEKAAAAFDDSEQSYASIDTIDRPAPVRPTYNPFRVRSHTSTWNGDPSMISVAF